MKSRYLIAAGTVLLAVVGVTIAQQKTEPRPVHLPQPVPLGTQPTPAIHPPLPAGTSLPPALPTEPGKAVQLGQFTATSEIGKEVKPDEMTIEQLAEALKSLRAERAEMDAREKAMVKALRKKGETLRQLIDSVIGDTGPSGAVVPGSNGIHGIVAPATHPTLPTAPTSP